MRLAASPSSTSTIGHLIGDVLDGLASNRTDNSAAEAKARQRVAELCDRFPIYSGA